MKTGWQKIPWGTTCQDRFENTISSHFFVESSSRFCYTTTVNPGEILPFNLISGGV
ncbi:MAG: hypothetical protein J7M18_04370 [Candidatus Eremiobacteraeota bacterium]|nr:hypothetical protein [Candidatus Eremiobacteraeota bacterium]